MSDTIEALRELIVRSAPEPHAAEPVRHCDADTNLDTVIPFSSLMILGTVIAIEDHFAIRVTRKRIEAAAVRGITLRKLAALVEAETTS